MELNAAVAAAAAAHSVRPTGTDARWHFVLAAICRCDHAAFCSQCWQCQCSSSTYTQTQTRWQPPTSSAEGCRHIHTHTHSLSKTLSLCVPFPSSKSHGGSRRSLCPSPRHYRLAFTHCTPGLNTFSLAKELTRSLFLLHSRWPCVCQTQLPVLYNCCPFPFDLFLSAGDFKSVLIMQMEPVLVNEYRGR